MNRALASSSRSAAACAALWLAGIVGAFAQQQPAQQPAPAPAQGMPPAAHPSPAGAPAAPSAAATAASETLYQQNCASCHGANRLGGTGPALIPEGLARLKADAAKAVIGR